MRYLIKFTKGENIKFISHLDLTRTVQRIAKRTELPAEYSRGFNPHMELAIAQPLSVGVYSEGDYLDFLLLEDLECDDVLKELNEMSTPGIEFLSASKTPIIHNIKKIPPAMALLDAADYEIKIKYLNTESLKDEMDKILNSEEFNILKKTKKGEKIVDIKPLVKEFNYEIKDNLLIVKTKVDCGSRSNLSPDLLTKYIKDHSSNVNEDAFTDIKRVEMYGYKNNELVPLYKYVD
ncbi:MAG: TIGR03936 family radical SAM-associated protein [Sarcina sp.]